MMMSPLYCTVDVILEHPNWEFDLCSSAAFPPFSLGDLLLYYRCFYFVHVLQKRGKEREKHELHPKAMPLDIGADEHCATLLSKDSQTYMSISC